jgi:Carboxypeptidase regulatory-like domain
MRLSQVCLCLIVAGSAVCAQEPPQSVPAAVEGFVTSDVTAVVPGATIHLDSRTLSYHRETTTDASGYYVMEELRPGAYSLYAEIRAYGCIIYPHIALMPRQSLRQDFVFVRAKRTLTACEPSEESRKRK